jgi:AbrB family looped-hinge helix DNA binding protein
MVFKSTLSSKGQVTVPKEVRDFLGASEGDQVIFDIAEGEVRVRATKRLSIDELFAQLPKAKGEFLGFEQEKALYGKHRLERHKRSLK